MKPASLPYPLHYPTPARHGRILYPEMVDFQERERIVNTAYDRQRQDRYLRLD